MYTVPTLLIGLGGIGTLIVDRVYGMIPPERRGRVAVHGFDTNVHDIARRTSLRGRLTQTSTEWTVGQYLHFADPSVRDWFPADNRELLRKTLTDGAGQIRVVARLAYRAAIEQGRLGAFEAQVANVFRVMPDDHRANVRVVIVSSLAGGTGSGMFLQTALYVRELLERSFARQNVLVRGAFILPDALIQTRVLEAAEYDDVRANAYASLKELDAITKNRDVTIELEYKPDQNNRRGEPSLVITEEQLPYDFAFLYDFENAVGENLGHWQNYLDQVVETVFLSLFSPIEAAQFSREDNQILAHVRGGGANRYCGAGVAVAEYPYEAILDYCALRWSTDSLTDQWLKLDNDYQQELHQYERDLRAGVARERPRIEERYVYLLDSYAGGERPDRFFRAVHASTRLKDEQGRPGAPKANLLLEAIKRETDRRVAKDELVDRLAAGCTVDLNELRNRERVRRHVDDVESSLQDLHEAVRKAIDENKTVLVNEILLRDQDERSKVGGQDHRLNTWLLARNEPLHPVAVRYILFRLLGLLDQEIQALEAGNQRLESMIDRYQKSYDNPETEYEEKVVDILEHALSQGRVSAIVHSRFGEFVADYQEKASRHLGNLRRFHRDRTTELVLKAVRESALEMLREWKLYFDNLRDVRNNLLNEINKNALEHETAADPTRHYVLASRADKRAQWDEVRRRLSAGANLPATDLPSDIARQIYLAQYERFCQWRLSGEAVDPASASTEQDFREHVVDWCRDQLRADESLNRNLIRALRIEASRKGIPEAEHIEATLGSLSNLAHPLVQPVERTPRQHLYWGAHTAVVAELSEQQRQQLFGPELIGDENRGDDAFSPYKVIRYRSNYGYLAEDFPKFGSGAGRVRTVGAYYLAYRDRVRRLDEVAAAEITPHLDRRWHVLAYLPDLSEARTREENQRLNEAFILGLAYGHFRVGRGDDAEVWGFYGTGRPQSVPVFGRPVSARLPLLLDALRYNPIIVDQVLERATGAHSQDRDAHPVGRADTPEEEMAVREALMHNHRFIAGCLAITGIPGTTERPRNLLDVVISLSMEVPRDDTMPRRAERLLECLVGELMRYNLSVYGEHRAQSAAKQTRELVKRMLNDSETYQTSDPETARRRGWDDVIQTQLEKLDQDTAGWTGGTAPIRTAP